MLQASDRINSNPGLTFYSKPLGIKVLIDESIADYQFWVRGQRRISLAEEKREEQWQKAVAAAELTLFFVPVFGVVGVSCKLLRAASTVAELIEGADKWHELITNPEKMITEEFLDFILAQGYKKVLILDKLKIHNNQKAVIELVGDGAKELSKSSLNKQLQVSTLGFSVDYDKAGDATHEYDAILQHICAFRYQYDNTYREQSDAFASIMKNFHPEQSGINSRAVKIAISPPH
jgi:hypothetical protein